MKCHCEEDVLADEAISSFNENNLSKELNRLRGDCFAPAGLATTYHYAIPARFQKTRGTAHPWEDQFEPTAPRGQLSPALRAFAPHADGLFARALFVDLGYGFDARTTLESAARLRRVNPDLPILGVEIEKERVEAALPFADEKTFFRLGGFNLPLKEGEHVQLIRAFNVLR